MFSENPELLLCDILVAVAKLNSLLDSHVIRRAVYIYRTVLPAKFFTLLS